MVYQFARFLFLWSFRAFLSSIMLLSALTAMYFVIFQPINDDLQASPAAFGAITNRERPEHEACSCHPPTLRKKASPKHTRNLFIPADRLSSTKLDCMEASPTPIVFRLPSPSSLTSLYSIRSLNLPCNAIKQCIWVYKFRNADNMEHSILS